MDELAKKLAQALRDEFPFIMGIGIEANDESWEKAARGILTKMGAANYVDNKYPDIAAFIFEGV
jgi:hypothetical protein